MKINDLKVYHACFGPDWLESIVIKVKDDFLIIRQDHEDGFTVHLNEEKLHGPKFLDYNEVIEVALCGQLAKYRGHMDLFSGENSNYEVDVI